MRFQLALNVRDLDEAIAWYTKLLGVGPAKRKPGYANFASDDPPLKLALFEAPDATERLNHVGFEVKSPEEVERALARLEPVGLVETVDREERCCHALKSTVWSRDPQGLGWELYWKRADLAEDGRAEEASSPASVAAPAPSADASGAACAAPAGATTAEPRSSQAVGCCGMPLSGTS